jgi:AraC-like DNA-binding protein
MEPDSDSFAPTAGEGQHGTAPRGAAVPPSVPQGRLLDGAPAGAAVESLFAHVTCSVVQAGCWLPVPRDWSLDVPGRPNYTFWLCSGGWAEYRLDGQPYVLTAGSVILAPPRQRRQGRHDPGDPLHLYTVHLNARLYGVLDAPAVCRLPTALRPRPKTFVRMVSAAREIVEEFAGAYPGYALVANGACARLLALFWRESLALQPPTAGGDAVAQAPHFGELARLAPVFRVIEEQYGEPLALRDLAAAAHLHPAYLSTVFGRAVGVPPLRYLARYRLDRARELLLSTDLTVTAIASRTGFGDPRYLSRVFRRAEGITPAAYRHSKKSPPFA